jgi:hypothetical protein
VSTAADDQPLLRRDGLKKKLPRRALKNTCRCRACAAMVSKKMF